VRTAPAPEPRSQPWRRTSGIHRVRGARALAAVRALWEARDALARQQDIAPGRVLPDSAIINAAMVGPSTEAELRELPVFRGRAHRSMASYWLDALKSAKQLSSDELPDPSPPHTGPPPPGRWGDKDPAAAARLRAGRAALNAIAEKHQLPVENVLPPDAVRRLCWRPPHDPDPASVRTALRSSGAREWQIELTADALSAALRR